MENKMRKNKKNKKKKIISIVLYSIPVFILLLIIILLSIKLYITSQEPMNGHFYKNNPTDKIWWVSQDPPVKYGVKEFSFDRKKIYNLWEDYPDNMTEEEVKIFDEENPFWAGFLKNRKNNDK